MEPRDQIVYSLNVKSDLIRETAVNDVHYEKIGYLDITYESAKNLAKHYRPDIYKSRYRSKQNDAHRLDDVLYPVEELLSKIEQVGQRQILRSVIKQQGITSITDKQLLSYSLFAQWHRSHAAMNSGFEDLKEKGIGEFAYFVLLHWKLSDENYVNAQLKPWLYSNWKFYRTASDSFPLSDSAVLANRKSIMVALSPRLLLEIPLQFAPDPNGWSYLDGIVDAKLDEFRQRTIGNTFREIIFSNKALLEGWQRTKEFKARVETIRKIKTYNRSVVIEGQRSFVFNALGNQTFTSNLKRKRHHSRK